MNRQNYLDENIQRLVESTEPQLELPKHVKTQVLSRLAGETEKSAARKILLAKIKRACISLTMASAVAAMILLAVFTIGGPGTRRASAIDYTFEDTINALRTISTVHTICTDWKNRKFETWAKIDPQTGKAVWACVDNRPSGGKIVASTAEGSCVWDKNGDVVTRTNKILVSDQLRYARLFNELSQRQSNPLEDEKVDIYEEADPKTGDKLIVIWAVTKTQDFKIYVDQTTKLPLRMHFDRADN